MPARATDIGQCDLGLPSHLLSVSHTETVVFLDQSYFVPVMHYGKQTLSTIHPMEIDLLLHPLCLYHHMLHLASPSPDTITNSTLHPTCDI